MIALIPIYKQENLDQREENLPVSFDFSSFDPIRTYRLVKDHIDLVYVRFYQNKDTVFFLSYLNQKRFNQDEMDALYCLVQRMIQRILCDYRPHKLITLFEVSPLFDILQQQLFYKKGNLLQRIVEPYRYLLSDACFDAYGYLIDQGLMGRLPFGNYTVKEKGCGFISAYNLLRYGHIEQTMQDVLDGLNNYGFKSKHLGENMFVLGMYLKKQGLNIHYASLHKGHVINCMNKSKAGILLYKTKHGAHFTMYINEGKRCHFYNAVYGRSLYCLTPDDFIQKHHHTHPILSVWYLL